MQHSLVGSNSLPPDQMSADARLAELSRIVAEGILRLREQSSSISDDIGDSSLGIPPTKSISCSERNTLNGEQ